MVRGVATALGRADDIAHAVHGGKFSQPHRFGREAARRRAVFQLCDILLGHGVHRAHRAVDLAEAFGLTRCRASDIADQQANRTYSSNNGAKLGPAFAARMDAGTHMLASVVISALMLCAASAERCASACTSVATTAMPLPASPASTAPDRFHDIARQKIGLKGNAIDHRIIRPISCAQASIAAMASIARRMTSLASRSACVIV